MKEFTDDRRKEVLELQDKLDRTRREMDAAQEQAKLHKLCEGLDWASIKESHVLVPILRDLTRMVIDDAKVKLLNAHLCLNCSYLDKILLELQAPISVGSSDQASLQSMLLHLTSQTFRGSNDNFSICACIFLVLM